MKRHLETPPLALAAMHLEFSQIPSIAGMTTELANTLLQKMIDIGFPEKIISQQQRLEVNFDLQDEKSAARKITTVQRNLFRAAGEKNIIELTESSLIFRTTDYNNFESFSKIFIDVLQLCEATIPGFNKCLMKFVGLRYADIIVPNPGFDLDEFVKDDILPSPLSVLQKQITRQGVTITRVKTGEAQYLNVNFEELPKIDNKIHKLLPDNLIEGDPKCGLQISLLPWWGGFSSEYYGILDIDHQHFFQGSPQFDIKQVESIIECLYNDADAVFWSVLTEQALKSWGYIKD